MKTVQTKRTPGKRVCCFLSNSLDGLPKEWKVKTASTNSLGCGLSGRIQYDSRSIVGPTFLSFRNRIARLLPLRSWVSSFKSRLLDSKPVLARRTRVASQKRPIVDRCVYLQILQLPFLIGWQPNWSQLCHLPGSYPWPRDSRSLWPLLRYRLRNRFIPICDPRRNSLSSSLLRAEFTLWSHSAPPLTNAYHDVPAKKDRV